MLTLTYAKKYKELDLEQIQQYAGYLVTYKVTAL